MAVPEGGDSDRHSVTVLHLAGLPAFRRPADEHADLVDTTQGPDWSADLFRMIAADPQLRPDLVLVAGNLATRGRKWEYDQAGRYIAALMELFALPAHRVVLVPGEGDVNRDASAAYFMQRAAEDEEAEPPYWPKWTPFSVLFGRFYQENPKISFAPGEPWSLFEVPELRVVVAGINSTMAHSHNDADNYGLIGEQQAEWFQSRLARYADLGWLRIGVIRHAPGGGRETGAEELRDAEQLNRLIAPDLNLLAHGSLSVAGHQDRAGLPVLGAGGRDGPGPAAKPTGFELLQIRPEGLTRYVPATGDPASSRPARLVREDIPGAFESVGATFPSIEGPATEAESPQPGGKVRRVEDFADRVKEICALRHPGSTIVAVPATAKAPMYLRVSSVEDTFVTQRPVGLAENGVDDRIVDQFVQHVHQDFAAADPYLVSEFVYSGAPADDDLVAGAHKRGVNLLSFVEYQGLMDLRSYLARQTERLANSKLYPPATYVPQRYRVIGTDGIRQDLLEEVFGWVEADEQRFVLLLGDFGLGKTFLMQELARRMPDRLPHVVPMLLELRTLEKARSVDELVAQHLAFSGEKRINLEAFRYMLRSGRIVLLFDGFDELALRVSYDRAADRLQTLLQGLEGRAKLIISSRSQHFMSTQQVLTALGERVERVHSSHLVELVDFTDEQIREYLVRLYKDDHLQADARLDLIKEIRDLLGLSRNPRMLGFIANLDEARLRRVQAREGSISSADLYRELLDHWFRHEDWRASPRGASSILSTDDRWRAVRALAARLWQSGEPTVAVAELEEETTQALGPLVDRFLDHDQAAQLVGSGTLLVRDDEGRFSFVHQSVLEWLIADEAARHLQAEDHPAEILGQRHISALMADFFAGLAGRGRAIEWARWVLDDPAASDIAKSNALLIQDRVGVQHAVQARLSGQNLRGNVMADSDLSEADLAGADLTAARLVKTNLTRASLRDAQIVGAALNRVTLVGADLVGADFTEARLVSTDLTGAFLTGSRWSGASLVDVTVDPAALAGPELAEAAIAGRDPAVLQRPPAAAPAIGISFAPNGRMLAYGMGQTVVIAGPDGGRIHRCLQGHTDTVTAVAFSPDGGLLASGSLDATVQVWRVDDVTRREVFTDADAQVHSVAFSPDGTLLAGGSEDGGVYLWRVGNGTLRGTLGQGGPAVHAVAFSPDGTLVAAACLDGNVRLWNVADGSQGRTLNVSPRAVLALAFSPEGSLLATGGSDGKARLWRVADGAIRDELSAHIRVVLGVAFSADGTQFATCGGDGNARLWSVADGSVVATLSGHDDEVQSVAYSPDGDLLGTTGTDGTVRVWSVSSQGRRFTLTGRQNDINDLAVSADGQFVATGTDDGRVRLWNLSGGTCSIPYREHADAVFGVGFSSDGRLLAIGGVKGTVQLRQLPDGAPCVSPAGTPHSGPVRKVVFSRDNTMLATSAAEGRIRLWRVADAARLNTLASPTRTIAGLAFAREDSILVTAGGDETIQLWNLEDGTWQDPLLTGRTRVVSALAFNPAGSLLASGGSDGTVQLWRFADRTRVGTMRANRGWVHSAAFSHDGVFLATAGQDETVRVWRVSDGAEVATLTGHSGAVYDVAFCPGGLVASAGADGVVILWRPPATAPVATLVPFDGDGWATLLPDGRYKLDGEPGDAMWWAIKLCRFGLGQLDAPVDRTIRRLAFEAKLRI